MAQLEAVRYTQKVPPEWPNLLDIAERVTALPRSEQQEAVVSLIKEVDCIDNSRLDVVRYYGLGRGCCAIARTLVEPERREQIVDYMARRSAAAHADFNKRPDTRPSRTLRVNEVVTNVRIASIDMPFRQLLTGFTAAEDVALNALTVVKNARLPTINRSLQDRLPDAAAAYAERTMHRSEGVRSLQVNLFSASCGLVEAALYHLYSERMLNSGRQHQLNPTIRSFIRSSDLLKLDLTMPAMRTARLRVDTFRHLMKGMPFTGDLATGLDIRPECLERIPPEEIRIPPGKLLDFLHTDSIGCPALYVLKLISTIMNMTCETVVRTNRLLSASE